MRKQSIGVGLVGLGVVGGQVARVLLDRGDILAEQAGCPLVLRKVKVLESDLSRPLAREMDAKLFTTDADEFFADSGIDIVVEAMGGENPALQYITRALSSGKHVVTSNKEVIAKHGAELLALAQQHGVGLRYEAISWLFLHHWPSIARSVLSISIVRVFLVWPAAIFSTLRSLVLPSSCLLSPRRVIT